MNSGSGWPVLFAEVPRLPASLGPGYHRRRGFVSPAGLSIFPHLGETHLCLGERCGGCGNSSLPFLLLRKQQQQSWTPVLGDSAAPAPQEWWWEELFRSPPSLANHNCTAPAFPPSFFGWRPAGWRSLGKFSEPRSQQTVPGALAGSWTQDASSAAQPPVWMRRRDVCWSGTGRRSCAEQVTHVLLGGSRKFSAQGWGWSGRDSGDGGQENWNILPLPLWLQEA